METFDNNNFLKNKDILFDILEVKRRKGWETVDIGDTNCSSYIWDVFDSNEYVLVTADFKYMHKMTDIIIYDNSIEFHCRGKRHRVYCRSIKTMNLYDNDDFYVGG